jgi:hypothetical protein
VREDPWGRKGEVGRGGRPRGGEGFARFVKANSRSSSVEAVVIS